MARALPTAWRVCAGVVLALLCQPAQACRTKPFPGNEFLRAAASAGIRPRVGSRCATVNVLQNSFHALPDKDCVLSFIDSDWLRDDMRFIAIHGFGTFDSDPLDDGFEVRIEKEGGYRVVAVVIETGDPDPKSCEKLRVNDVVR